MCPYQGKVKMLQIPIGQALKNVALNDRDPLMTTYFDFVTKNWINLNKTNKREIRNELFYQYIVFKATVDSFF
ncbi:MAG TPA: hypothetical protein DDY13_20435 [Cytophagales bacterium]|jgi:hypothetical protein|nr:hypothetical protein [Cytophagales bacterium]